VTILDEARQDLAARVTAVGATGDWDEQSILAPLADVADHVCRVGDHRESAHYRADKAGALLSAAIRLQRETLLGFAGWPDEGWHLRTIVEAFDVLEQVRQAVGTVAWMAARQARDHCSTLYESDARRLFEAARQFSGWVEDVADTPEPDWSED
jgi:hypothetical protein